MGLSATKNKQRFGFDPRNTAWSNDTSRFGHTMLEKYGWKPGMGLGAMPHKSSNTHIRVSIKDDNLGLGAKSQRSKNPNGLDDESAGLDVFQKLLGRLNGKEETISKEVDRQRYDRIINGKWGVHFVKGEVLSSTWDPHTKKLRDYSNKENEEELDGVDKKRKASDEDTDIEKHRKHKREKKGHKRHRKAEKEQKRREKKEKKQKKEKKEQKKRETKHKEDSTEKSPTPELTRLSARSRYIRQKKAATMDPKALNEIFMVAQ